MKNTTFYEAFAGIVWPVAAGLLFLACGSWVHSAEAVVLITETEAAMEDAPPEVPAAKILEKDSTRGPMIIVHSPKEGETYPAPLVVNLNFRPQPETAVDINTLRVFYRKLIAIDITDRIRPYATENGIYIPEAEIPEGTHQIQIRIADNRGNVSVRDLTFSVQ